MITLETKVKVHIDGCKPGSLVCRERFLAPTSERTRLRTKKRARELRALNAIFQELVVLGRLIKCKREFAGSHYHEWHPHHWVVRQSSFGKLPARE